MIKSICIFCGSQYGNRDRYRSDATRLGELCAVAGLDIIYGGGHVGLMGAVADAAMKAGGRVIGFIPEHLLAREVGHEGISELIVTKKMSDRKDQMIERSDAFAILPGGLGTLDELFEVLTLHQLGYHQKPAILINSGGYWDPLLALIQRTVDGGFADQSILPMMKSVDHVDALFASLGLDTPLTETKGGQTMPLSTRGMV